MLYVGKALDLRARVRSHFYGDERPQTAGLVREAARVEVERCPTELAAEIRELELIRAHRPRCNRRGRRPQNDAWVRLAAGQIPRFVVTSRLPEAAAALLGPFPGRKAAAEVAEAMRSAAPLPRCSRPQDHPEGCAFGQMGHCVAPCLPGRRAEHAELAAMVVADVDGGGALLLDALRRRMGALAAAQRYEEAAVARDRIGALARALERRRIVRTLEDAEGLVVCRPGPAGVEAAAVRRGGWSAPGSLGKPPSADPQAPFGQPSLPAPGAGRAARDVAEVLLVWRFIARAVRAGGWVAWCSGTFACRPGEPRSRARARAPGEPPEPTRLSRAGGYVHPARTWKAAACLDGQVGPVKSGGR